MHFQSARFTAGIVSDSGRGIAVRLAEHKRRRRMKPAVAAPKLPAPLVDADLRAGVERHRGARRPEERRGRNAVKKKKTTTKGKTAKSVKVKDLKPRKDPKGGRRGNTVGGT
ncbi:MAG: hypothetical protein QOD06_258 [Candidatus Binatota bacterium]|jgi:hypothetical protein|nr:hypothetical protein [Candidatus Binatota bacterium]